MPQIETVDDLVEALADWCGIYHQGLQFVGLSRQQTRQQVEANPLAPDPDHDDACQCRICWCGVMERRIRAAVAHEEVLAAVIAARRQRGAA